MNKSKLFIGSSVEGLNVAYAIQSNLVHNAETTVWDQGVFNLSESSLESLIKILDESDFGVFVFTPDDYLKIRGKNHLSVRDNVIFELGLFVGKLGRNRAFIVIPDNKEFHLPTDLIGLTPGKYEASRVDNNLLAGTGIVSHKIREQIQTLGPIDKSSNDIPEISNPIVPVKKKVEEDWVDAYLEKDYDKAISLLKKKARYCKDADEKLSLKSQICYVEFVKDPIKGVKEYEKEIAENPENNIPYIAYSSQLYDNKDYNKALEIVEIGLIKSKRKISLTILKGECYWVLKRKEEAIELLENSLLLKLDPLVLLKLVEYFLEEKNNKGAIDLLKKAYLAFPNNEQIKYKYARVAYDNNFKELSILLYKELINEFNDNSTYWCLIGNSYLDFELYNLALVAYEKAAELSEHKEGWIYDNIGNLYNRKELFEKAAVNLKKALQLNDKSDYTYNRLSSAYASSQNETKKVVDLIQLAKTQLAIQEGESQ